MKSAPTIKDDFESSLGHESYDLNVFLDCFLGDNEQVQSVALEHLLLTVVTRYFLSIKYDNKNYSGFYAMELLVNLMKRVDESPKLQKLRYIFCPLLIKFHFSVDKMYFRAYEHFGKNEQSMNIPDKVVFISLKHHRLLMMEFFMLMICISSGQRRTVLNIMNPRLLDINMLWIKEKLDNSFIMVEFDHSSPSSCSRSSGCSKEPSTTS